MSNIMYIFVKRCKAKCTFKQLRFMWVGLDVSKETINYAIPNPRSEGHFRAQGRISNNLNGFRMLEKQLLTYKDIQYKLACETTGIYSFPIMDYFSQLGWHCNEIHAFQTSWYKKTILSRAKTDKIDAREIADYARRYKEKLVKPYISRTPELIELALLMRMLNQIEKKQRAFLNIGEAYDFISNPSRVEGLTFQYAQKGLKAITENDKKFQKNFIKGIADFCKNNFDTYDYLMSIKGIGERTVPKIILYTNNFTRFKSGREFSAYAGVVPNSYESGTSVKFKNKIAHKSMCNNNLRTAMSQAAGVAMRHNKQVKDTVARLPHLAYKQQLMAAANKLCRQVHHIGQNRVMYDPNKA